MRHRNDEGYPIAWCQIHKGGYALFVRRIMLPMCDEEVKQSLEAVLLNTGLPVTYPYDKERVREIISHDKKSGGNKISVVKCDEIGSFYFEELTIDEIMNLI